jgi:tripartite-type tricarboxylate transporter receptor subunit TctC
MIARLIALAFAALFTATPSLAQNYPAKPLRLLVPFGPGGVGDITARAVAQKMGDAMGQQVIIDNRPSAGGIVAAETVAKSDPDGYTLYLMNNTNAVSAAMFKKLPYDTVRDFETVSTIGGFSIVILVAPDSPAKTVKELIAQAKGAGGKFNIGSINIGSTQHLAAELLKSMAALDAAAVPFNNTGAVLTALRGGSVQVATEFVPAVLGQIRANALRAIAVGSAVRSPMLRCRVVERHRRGGENAESDCRAPEPGNPRRGERAGGRAALSGTRRQPEPVDARRHAQAAGRRNRQVECADRQDQDTATVNILRRNPGNH